ncbi:hypothetical protein BDR05DRAFT_969029 [Suillus weaverae]|nr:hypothetical protein BDR05DRAFT_969029 [Suillus weaverae]
MATLLSPALSMSTTDSTPFSQYHSIRPSPTPSSSSSSSSGSLNRADEENLTITASRSLLARNKGKRKSYEDIRLLAISTHITELSYSISDIQTRIFEIQELRHKSQSSGDAAATTVVIDKALMTLDERLEAVACGMKSMSESVTPFQNQPDGTPDSEQVALVRKHAVLVTEWEAVQNDTDVLREELKEDKWLTVFRTVTEQADGMMGSLEKAVNRCQDFIWQVHRGGAEDSLSQSSYRASVSSDKNPLSIEVFNELLNSFEAKKKHYVPATSKVLAIIDNGVQNRVTKNGETLRRHGESAKRWRILKERMAKTEKEMEAVRKILTGDVARSETGSTASGYTANGYLATPANRSSKGRAPSRATSSTSTLSRSISPLRKFARKITGHVRSPPVPVTPLPVSRELSSVSRDSSQSQGPSSEPTKTLRRQRTSIFAFNRSASGAPLTPEKGHKYSHSLTPESSPASKRLDRIDDPNSTVKLKMLKQPWNSSTKVEAPDPAATIKPTPPKRPNAKSVYTPEYGPLVPSTPSRRSLSRSSNASSRPWSPVTSSASTNPSIPPLSHLRPPSRAQTPSLGMTPRPRPKTPSHIPAPALHWRSVSARQPDADNDDEELTTLMQRAFSPPHTNTSPSTFRSYTPSGVRIPPPRPPSRSQIPLPSVHVSSESRPSSSASFYRPQSPLTPGSLLRAQTPESQLKAKIQQIPFYGGAGNSGIRTSARQTVAGKLPPSSFRDSSTTRTPNSRPGSRSGSYTPMERDPMHLYVPASDKDPLDVEVAAIVNAIPHGLLIERVDPPLKAPPKEGEEIRASYAFSNSLSRKVVTCKLTTLTRSGARGGGMSKKVMCRVGGGWQDLQLYMLNRQAGM